ncbi:Cdc6/Cdc18 family protein [Salinibaculum rarum]|uniref:Cdc6/Cdc18 family protein n=1 Tax=Salinibaculum rarum TaxID=3058903 RepID=UPI00265D9D4A|nr:Cdc6/Cdc18 family protein [Salinibaculum sp. KK48]
MISDARALEHHFVPQDLNHRGGQIDALAAALEPITQGATGEHTLIVGPSGSGKTTLAKYVARKLERQRLDFEWGYVNCQSDPSPTAALHQLVKSAGVDVRRPEGTSRGYYFDRLAEHDGQLVTIVDEVNVISDPSLLHALHETPGVTIVGICIDDDDLLATADLNSGTESRLRSMRRLSLTRYTHDEILDILAYRVEHGLDSERVTDSALEAIADVAAGNARVAITHLRRAAKTVYESDYDTLTSDVVSEVADAAQAAVHDLHVRSLGTHQRALYTIIRDAASAGVRAGELHDKYEHRVQNPRGRSMRRRYLSSLERYGLITKSGSGRGTTYRVVPQGSQTRTVNPESTGRR